MDPDIREARNAGAKAFRDGKNLDSCPHPFTNRKMRNNWWWGLIVEQGRAHAEWLLSKGYVPHGNQRLEADKYSPYDISWWESIAFTEGFAAVMAANPKGQTMVAV